MLRNIEPHNLSATVSQDHHNIEQSKRGRQGDEHVDGGNAVPTENSLPTKIGIGAEVKSD
jgi:hypothetical protein